MAVYDTVLFVRKVLQQYFSQRDELNALKAQQASAFPTLNESPAATAGGTDLSIDIHNSDHLANAAQHAAVLQWFERRQIQIRANHDAVDTTGCGDSFMGTVLAGLASGMALSEAAELASYVSAYAATGYGAQASYGNAAQIREAFAK